MIPFGKHAAGWKGHRAWRSRRRKNAIQRKAKRINAQWRRWAAKEKDAVRVIECR